MPSPTQSQIADFYKKYEPSPLLRRYSKLKLLVILTLKKRWLLFHKCNWVYWRYGNTPRLHKVCDVCYSKKKLDNSTWVNDEVV